MRRVEQITLNTLLLFHGLLIMLLIFESRVSIPYWLQPLGRMHPLILHFPIAFIVLLVILSVFKNQIDSNTFKKINRFLVLFTAFTTVLATLMGLFLSLEGDSTSLLTLHKWIGVTISFLVYGLVYIKKENVFKAVLYIGFIGVIFAGHYGAGLTHGTNFITEPLKKEDVVEITEDTPIFQAFVKPILDAKCLSCHNSEKKKGDLDMSTLDKMMLGGKEGVLWIADNSEESALLKRVHLPISHKEHMPPKGKKQLTQEEIELITAWIDRGANDELARSQLEESDTLATLVAKRFSSRSQIEEPVYNFEFANKKDIDALKNPYRTIIQNSAQSPALHVSIYGRQTFKPEFLTDLSVIEKQIISLNLSFLPIDRSSFKFISSLSNLEDLVLNFTDLKTEDLQDLKLCTQLKTLALSGTQVDSNIHNLLQQLPKLNRVFLWNTAISKEEVEQLKTQFPNIRFETGFQNSEEKLELTAPLLLSKNTVIHKDDFVEFGHKMPGVEIRYTIDGTKPDTTSILYKTPIQIDLETQKPVRVIAYKDNWLPSEVKGYTFVDKGYEPEQFELVYPGIYSDFVGDATAVLIDHNKAGAYSHAKTSSFWGTFNGKHPLEATAYFGNNPPELKSIVLSYGMHQRQKKEPLALIEVWAGESKEDLSLLKRVSMTYRKIDKKKEGRTRKVVIEVPESNAKYYKVIAKPQKKEKLYVDQLFFY